MTDCDICCESFNKSNRKPVECLDCNNACCRECHQTYLFSRDIIDCMFCQKVQTYEHIKNSHYDTFIKSTGSFKGKGYREHLEEVYYKNEMAMFPETQKKIERNQVRDKVIIENADLILEISRIMYEIKKLKKERIINCNCKRGPSKCICVNVKERINWLKNRKNQLELIEDLKEKRTENFKILTNLYRNKTPIKEKVIERCMATECDGFLNTNWKCNKCDKITCKRCREIQDNDHVCDEDTVKTIKLAIRTSKPCPKCNERIHRIYGCDQVYCPLCKIVFSYSTGRLQIGGVIHQPDAVNELRQNGRLHRDIRDIPCGGVGFIFDQLQPGNTSKRFPLRKYKDITNIVQAFLRWCGGYEDYQAFGIQREIDVFDLNSDERYKFLTGDISKEDFKKKIYLNYKSFEKENDERILKAGLYVCIADMLRSFEDMSDYNEICTLISQIFILCDNYNDEFVRVNKLYNGLSHQGITIFMEIIRPSTNKITDFPKLYFGISEYTYNMYNGGSRYNNLNLESILNYKVKQ